MASTVYYFEGELNWAKLDVPDSKYENYQVEVTLTPTSKELFDESGLRLKVKQNEDGLSVVKFRRDTTKVNFETKEDEVQGPPEVVFAEGIKPDKWNGKIGNGSQGVVKVEVYDSKMGKGHRLLAAKVLELVTFGGFEEVPEGVLPF